MESEEGGEQQKKKKRTKKKKKKRGMKKKKRKLMKMPPHDSPSPIQYAQTHTLPAAGAIIFLFQFDTQAFSC